MSVCLMCPAGVKGSKTSVFVEKLESGGENLLMPKGAAGVKRMFEHIFHKPPKIPGPVLGVS